MSVQKMESHQVLWDQDAPVQGPLRAPRAITNQAPPRGASQPPHAKTTVLRADAPEFVPRNSLLMEPGCSSAGQSFENGSQRQVHSFENGPQRPGQSYENGPHRPRHSAQNRLLKFRNQNEGHVDSPQNTWRNEASGNDSSDIFRLKQIINSLIKYPGQFDQLLNVFIETIYPHFNDIITMSEIAQLLISQGINCPNFCYNSVRLCWFIEQKCPSFRAEIHLKCQKELQDNPNQQNVVLFIAELYTQLPHDCLYGSLLIDSLKKLLVLGGNDNIKCVCQALKLTGYSLEQNHKESLDDFFIQMKTLARSLSGSILTFLNSVINLRESNWGRTTTESSSSESHEFDQDYEEMVNEILYEADGQALTNEEQEFLAAHATDDDYFLNDDDPDALCDPEPEMDEEIQAAFKEFLQLSKGK